MKRRSEEIEAAEVENGPKRQKAESHGRAVVEVENVRKHEKAECHGRAVVADSHKVKIMIILDSIINVFFNIASKGEMSWRRRRLERRQQETENIKR